MSTALTIITVVGIIGIIIVAYQLKKKPAPTLQEKHDRFDEILREKIEMYRQRDVPELGKRYIRRAIDNLYETGYLKPNVIKEEFNKIKYRKSRLPLAQRLFIERVVLATAAELDKEIREEQKK